MNKYKQINKYILLLVGQSLQTFFMYRYKSDFVNRKYKKHFIDPLFLDFTQLLNNHKVFSNEKINIMTKIQI